MFELIRSHLGVTYTAEQPGNHGRELLQEFELIEATRAGTPRETEEGARIVAALIRTFEEQVFE